MNLIDENESYWQKMNLIEKKRILLTKMNFIDENESYWRKWILLTVMNPVIELTEDPSVSINEESVNVFHYPQ